MQIYHYSLLQKKYQKLSNLYEKIAKLGVKREIPASVPRHYVFSQCKVGLRAANKLEASDLLRSLSRFYLSIKTYWNFMLFSPH